MDSLLNKVTPYVFVAPVVLFNLRRVRILS
jgi:hypothetical protein